MQITGGKADESQKPIFAIEMNFLEQDFQIEWQRCSMLANYIAAYVAYQFTQYGRAENLISTVVNELLEAITRLSPGQSPLRIRCYQLPDGIRLDIQFVVRGEHIAAYMDFMQTLDDSEHQYLGLLTSRIQAEKNFNQLGLAMLAHDFNVKFKTNLDDRSGGVQTQIFIPTQEFLI